MSLGAPLEGFESESDNINEQYKLYVRARRAQRARAKEPQRQTGRAAPIAPFRDARL
jgi:hypothetical protein